MATRRAKGRRVPEACRDSQGWFPLVKSLRYAIVKAWGAERERYKMGRLLMEISRVNPILRGVDGAPYCYFGCTYDVAEGRHEPSCLYAELMRPGHCIGAGVHVPEPMPWPAEFEYMRNPRPPDWKSGVRYELRPGIDY
jgi:hypothetical protein